MSEEVKNEIVESTETNTTKIVEENTAKQEADTSAKKEADTSAKKENTERKESNSNERSSDSRTQGHQRRGPGRQGRDFQGGQQRFPKFRRKVCKFCYEKELKIDYKDSDVLEHFITDRGKILPRRVTGTCSKHQRLIARAIKRARIIALLPFVEQ